MAGLPAQTSQLTSMKPGAWMLPCLIAAGFTLGVLVEPEFAAVSARRSGSASMMEVLLGDGRQMFARHFFTKADAYFHSGNYPGIFDKRPMEEELHMAGAPAGDSHDHDHGDKGHHEDYGFRGPPLDWIDTFSRHFYVTQHTHLDQGDASREILPWLKLSAELDPGRLETYTVSAFWLRTQLGKVDEAEAFLREGLRANPHSPEILLELGVLYEENRKDYVRAANVLELGVRYLDQKADSLTEEDRFLLARTLGRLARIEQKQGHIPEAIHFFERLKPLSPSAPIIDATIKELRARQP